MFSRGVRKMMKKVGWATVGVSVAAAGLLLGRELRERYAFAHRSPYDFYTHAGDEFTDEAGVGV